MRRCKRLTKSAAIGTTIAAKGRAGYFAKKRRNIPAESSALGTDCAI
jgi:hypothetical protein